MGRGRPTGGRRPGPQPAPPRTGGRSRVAALGRLAAVALLLAATGASEAAGPAAGLKGLQRVAVEVVVEPEHPRISAEDLARRLDEILAQGGPAPRPDPRAPDLLRLTVSVESVSANELRGFYLPFSGTYGLGVVSLAVLRQVMVPGLAQPVPAVVWQADRVTRGGYARSDAEVAGYLEDLAEAFLATYRRAAGGS
jgi:hypothetical protein